jgi:dihydropteroate synthase
VEPWAHPPGALRLGRRTFAANDRLVMAVVNRTPDSFSDAGLTFDEVAALAAVDRAVAEGADIIDIGGVKAGAGPPVDVTEECRRVVPIVEAVRARHPDVVISVDTWRHEVGRAVAQAGADLLNDAWAGYDPRLAEVAGEYGLGLVCSHTGGTVPRTVLRRPRYDDVVAAVLHGLRQLVDRAVAAGVRTDGLLIDPAHDFGKTTWHSLEVTRRVDELVATGWPVLVAVSRKDFIGETLDRPVEARLAGTLAVTAWCAAAGARVFRAHDVRATRDVLDMVSAIQGLRPPARVVRGLE